MNLANISALKRYIGEMAYALYGLNQTEAALIEHQKNI